MKALATLVAAAFVWIGFAPTSHAQAYLSMDTPIAIPDGPGVPTACGSPGTPITSSITVADGGTISDLDVRLEVAHTWVGDLVITLDNGSTTIDLIREPGDLDDSTGCGDSSDGFNMIVDDEGTDGSTEDAPATPGGTEPAYTTGGRYTPNGSLSDFDGQTIAGTWTLTVIDTGAGDTGDLLEWELLFNGAFPTANENGPEGGIPDGYALSDVYPNPFRSEASFSLTVARAQEVTVGLYNLLGQRVATIYEGTLAAGQDQQLTVESGGLASGLYLIRVDAEDFSDTRRVTLLQ